MDESDSGDDKSLGLAPWPSAASQAVAGNWGELEFGSVAQHSIAQVVQLKFAAAIACSIPFSMHVICSSTARLHKRWAASGDWLVLRCGNNAQIAVSALSSAVGQLCPNYEHRLETNIPSQ